MSTISEINLKSVAENVKEESLWCHSLLFSYRDCLTAADSDRLKSLIYIVSVLADLALAAHQKIEAMAPLIEKKADESFGFLYSVDHSLFRYEMAMFVDQGLVIQRVFSTQPFNAASFLAHVFADSAYRKAYNYVYSKASVSDGKNEGIRIWPNEASLMYAKRPGDLVNVPKPSSASEFKLPEGSR